MVLNILILIYFSEAIKRFLAEFHIIDDEGNKKFKYARQLVDLAHREQVALTIDIDDLSKLHYAIPNYVKFILTLSWYVSKVITIL